MSEKPDKIIGVMPKVKVQLAGLDGNAFSIIGRVSAALKEAGLGHQVEKFQEEATSGDYDNVIQTSMKYVDVY